MSMSRINLTKLEKEVLKKLALEGPLSGYDFHTGGKDRLGRKRLMSPGHWETIKKKLGPKGKNLIEVLKGENVREEWLSNKTEDIEKGRGHEKKKKRKKKLYWLTMGGLLEAVKLGSPLESLISCMEKIFINTDFVNFFRGFAFELGETKFRKYVKYLGWDEEGLYLKTLPRGKKGKIYGEALKRIMRRYPNSKTTKELKREIKALKNSLDVFDV